MPETKASRYSGIHKKNPHWTQDDIFPYMKNKKNRYDVDMIREASINKHFESSQKLRKDYSGKQIKK